MRGFRKGWLILSLVIVFQVASNYLESEEDAPSIRRPQVSQQAPQGHQPQASGPVLPRASQHDPLFKIKTGKKSNSTGTAFAVQDDGIWITARHVVDGCDKVGLVTEPRRAIRVFRVLPHPRADMAMLWTRRTVPPLAISNAPLRVRQKGFHFGFPQSDPGQVTSTLLGRRNMRTTGRYRHTEPVIAWAELRRVPLTESLGGISGGPALNANGEIVGVTVASSKRRGRVYTTAPISMDQLLSQAKIEPNGLPSAGLNTSPADSNFIDYGIALRRQLTVAQVICRIEGNSRRRGRRL